MKIRILQLIALLMLPFAPAMAQEDKDHAFNVAKNMQVFNEIYNYLDLMYVDTLDADETVGTAINSMLRSLDPYTVYYPESEVKNLRTLITGRYVGIGAVIRYNQKLKRVVIDEPYAGNPAAEVGLKKGDIIISIDDSTMTDKDVSYVSSHLRGDAGTTFVLKIKRPSTGKEMDFKITRRSVEMPSIPFYGINKDGIGYLNLTGFTEGCAKEVRRAFVEMRHQGMRGFVLDLRGNGGGSLSEAVNIVNMFVPKGITLVKTRGKLKRANNDYVTQVEPIDSVMPVVVLVNGESASASEITSGSLQDLDRAVILGTRTYGKGLVQQTIDLSYNGRLKLTAGKYYIPSGRCIQAINYRHARGGYTEHIPDSLTKVFRTAGGREVRDGGGIKPDIVVRPDSLPNIAYYLTVTGLDSTEVLLDYEVDYIAKHPEIAPAADYRFVGSVPVAAGLYRTYFGIDPNYNAAGTFNEQIGAVPASLTAVEGAAYCLENTFDVDHQNQDQTTRVIVAATLTGVGGDATGNDFYVINNNKDNVLNTAGLEAYVKTQYLENPEIVSILTDANAGLKPGEENKLTGDDLTVTYGDRAASSADVMVLNITVNESAATKFKGEAIPAALGRIEGVIAEINEDKIAYYKGGVRADGAEIVPNDAPEIMQLLKDLWATGDTQKVTEGVLGATSIWGEDLNAIPGLAAAVKADLDAIQAKGMLETVKGIL